MTAFAIVFNPSKVGRAELEASLRLSAEEAAVALWYETAKDDPGHGMAREAVAAGATRVIAAGGDGTVRAVAEVLAGTDTVMGIVPQGTGNLLARNLHLPLKNPARAFRRAMEGEVGGVDVAWIEHDAGRTAFVVMAGFGVDAQMLEETDDELKAKAGWAAYVEAMGRAIAGADVVDVTMVTDDADERTTSAHTVMIGNCGTLTGGVQLLPDAKIDDGVLDVLVLSADGALGWLDTMKAMVWDNGVMRLFQRDDTTVETNTVERRTARNLRITLPEPRLVQVDGDPLAKLSAFEVTVDERALRVSR